MGERRGECRVLVGNYKGKRPLGKPRSRCEDNKLDLQEMGRGGAWTELIWLRIGTCGGTCKYGNEYLGSIKCLEFLDYLGTG